MTGEDYDTDNAKAFTLLKALVAGNAQAEVILNANEATRDCRQAHKDLKMKYEGVGVTAPARTIAERDISNMYYNGEKPNFTWETFESRLKDAYKTIDGIEKREVYSNTQKLSRLLNAVKADFLQHVKSSTLEPPAGTDAAVPTVEAANRIIDTAIADTIFALRSTLTNATNTTPGGLAFKRDMILDLPVIADLQQIQKHRQQLIDDRLITANRKRFSYDYMINDQVLKLVYKPDKLEPRAEGPYRIQNVHTNGTVTIRKTPFSIERINIRRIKPYRSP